MRFIGSLVDLDITRDAGLLDDSATDDDRP